MDKYISEVKSRLDGFDPTKPVTSSDHSIMIIAQIASHMSGLGGIGPPAW